MTPTVTPTPAPPPANDACSSATTVAVGAQQTLNTTGATSAASDPVQACTIGGASKNSRSVWYRYTPSSSGMAIANTVGSSYDTVLTVYTGTCAALSVVGCDDDGAVNATSRVQLSVTAGTSYLFEVTGKGLASSGGTLRFLVAQSSGSPVPTSTPQSTPGPPPPAADAKLVDKCQKEIKKAGAKVVATVLKSLANCGNRLMGCIQTKADPVKRASCLDGGADKCEASLAKIATARQTFTDKMLDRCASQVSVAELRSTSGLGFDLVAADCSEGLDSAAAIASCIGRQHQCEAERLFGATEPRARELMEVAGVSSTVLATLTCLEDHGGTGSDLDQEATNGKNLDRCVKGLGKAGTAFVGKKLKSLAKCVDAVFTCIKTKPGDDACLDKADAKCAKEASTIATAATTLRSSAASRCSELDYSTVLATPAGANLAALAAECAEVGAGTPSSFATYVECLARLHGCRAEYLFRLEAPRAAELLGGVSPPITFPSAGCPAP